MHQAGGSQEPFETLPDRAQIDAVLLLLPELEQPGAGKGEIYRLPGSLPHELNSPAVDRLHTALGRNGFIQPFDWQAWGDRVREFMDNPALLDSADLETLCRLLTAHVRADRFIEGHLNQVVTDGHIQAILRRLAVIRREMSDEPD